MAFGKRPTDAILYVEEFPRPQDAWRNATQTDIFNARKNVSSLIFRFDGFISCNLFERIGFAEDDFSPAHTQQSRVLETVQGSRNHFAHSSDTAADGLIGFRKGKSGAFPRCLQQVGGQTRPYGMKRMGFHHLNQLARPDGEGA